jgi:hypothetical protein
VQVCVLVLPALITQFMLPYSALCTKLKLGVKKRVLHKVIAFTYSSARVICVRQSSEN